MSVCVCVTSHFGIVRTGCFCMLMEKVAPPPPPPNAFQRRRRVRLPIALQVWSFPNRYYNKLHSSLLQLCVRRDNECVPSHSSSSSSSRPPPVLCNVRSKTTWATCEEAGSSTIRWRPSEKPWLIDNAEGAESGLSKGCGVEAWR